jgi:pimeloyl-ACP methyl ester carboxylesterase
MSVRALYRAVSIPGAAAPYASAALKVYYPACYSGTEEERNSGVIPAASEGAPFPVAIIMPGINVGPESYSWLALELAAQGVVTVTYTLVAEEMPGYISLTPGLALAALMPANYGRSASATALAPIIEELAKLNAEGLLAGLLDLEKIILGGHSAGGSVALLNARRDWFPGLRAVFTYGAHAGAATALGYAPHSLYALSPDLPLLIMGGTRDGCIAHSAGRYGDDEVSSPTALVERTFDEAISRDRGDCYLALIEGANHFSMSWPHDDSTGRPFIDLPTTRPDAGIRELLANLAGQFIAATASGDRQARALLETTLLQPQAFISRGDRR